MTVTYLDDRAAAIFYEDELLQLREFFAERDDEADNLALHKLKCFIDYYFETR